MARVAVHFDGVSRGAEQAAKRTARGIDEVGDAAKRNERKVSSFASGARRSLLAVGGVLGRAAAVGGGVAAGGLIGSIVYAGFKFDDLKQKSTIAFTTMLGSGKKAAAFLKELTGFANKTPFELPGLIQASQKLLAVGFQAKQIIPTLTAVGNAVSGMGGDPQAMETTIRAIGQVQSKGRLMAEEMMQLNEAGTFSWKALATEIGTSVPKAMALVQKGAVSSDAFLAAFAANSNRRFGGMMEQQSHTFSGLLSTLKDKFSQVSGTVMQPFFDLAVKGMESLVKTTSSPEFTAGVQRLAKWLEDHVVPALRSMVSWIVDNRGRIANAFKGAADAAAGVAKAVKAIFDRVSDLKGALGVSWTTVFEAAFGVVMLAKVAKLRTALVGGGAASAAGTAGLLGALRLLARNPWTISVVIGFTYKGALSDTSFGKKWNQVWDSVFGALPGPKSWFVKPDDPAAPSAGIAGRGDEGTRGANAPGGQATLTAPTAWDNPGAGHAGGQTKGMPLGRTAGPKDMFFAEAGTTIGAPEDGTVVRIGSAEGGQSIWFKADSGPMYWLGHVVATVKAGTHVRKGQVIAKLYGAKGFTTHLHIDKTDQQVNVPTAPGGGSVFGDAGDLVGGGTDASKAEKADPKEAFRDRRGLAAISAALSKIRSAKVRGQLAKRVGLITRDLAGADTEDELSAVTKRVENLKDRLADVLGNQSARQKAASEKLRERMKEIVRKAVEAAALEVKRKRDVFSTAFALVADKALSVFDAKTRRLLDGARVSLFGTSFGAGDETPAERALRELRASRAADELARSRADALANATPEEAAALRAQYALDDQEAALEAAARNEREAADSALDAERARIQDERDALKERFAARLAEIKVGFDNETLTATTAQEQLLAALAEYDGAFADVGALLGTAFAAGFQSAVGASGAAAAALSRTPSQTYTAAQAGGFADTSNLRHFARGGKVPGVYIGRDSVPAMLMPGETVIDRSTTAALEQFLASGGGGLTIVVSGNTLLGDDAKIARELSRLIQPELNRLASYRADR